MSRILLPAPHMSGEEQAWVKEAFASNCRSSVGAPNIAGFELAIRAVRLGPLEQEK